MLDVNTYLHVLPIHISKCFNLQIAIFWQLFTNFTEGERCYTLESSTNFSLKIVCFSQLILFVLFLNYDSGVTNLFVVCDYIYMTKHIYRYIYKYI